MAQLTCDMAIKDEFAFKEIFDRIYPALYNYSKKMCGCRYEAEDISIASFQKLYERRNCFKTEIQAKTFLFIVARNKCLNHLRYKKDLRKNLWEYARRMETSSSFHSKYEMTEYLLNPAIEKLPNECRKIIKMILRELKPGEIASRLNISIMTVYNQKANGIKKLRSRLKEGSH
jgi:RNA polymerase sigma-70 factor (ECF subfamily)